MVRDAILRNFIRSGALAPGDRLPGEAELAARYGVSRVTLRAATRSLQEAGFVSIRQGVGTVVLASSGSLTSGLDALVSLETVAGELGVDVTTRDLRIVQAPVPAAVADQLELRGDALGTTVERVKVVLGMPVAFMVDFVPAAVVDTDVLKSEFAGSTLDAVLRHHDIEYADCEVTPVALPHEIATRIGAVDGVPALHMEELNRAANGRPIFWGESWMLPDHLSFRLRRRKIFRG